MSGTPQPIAEHEARGETARIYHEIRQTMRVSGVNLNFRTWAGFPHFFPAMWAAMQPLAASQAFESAADRVRSRAADLVLGLPALQVRADLGESQRYQIEKALALYHYVNPKLLVFTVLVKRGLMAGAPSRAASGIEMSPKVPFGAPPDMAAMEMVDASSRDRRLLRLFRDIQKTMGLSSVNSDYRTLALWPDYLEPAWTALKPVVRTAAYQQAAGALERDASAAADRLPSPTSLDHRRLRARSESTRRLLEITTGFERLLPPLILNIALLARDWMPEDRLRRSPYPLVNRAIEKDRGAS